MRAYVSGAITCKEERTDQGVLRLMVNVVKDCGYEVYCAEQDTNQGELNNPDISFAEIFQKDLKQVADSNLIVLESSNPSTGNGMEIMLAYLKKKRIILCAREGIEVSRIACGTPGIELIYYNSMEGLENKLKNKLMTETKYARPSWDDYFMALAKIVGMRGSCDRLRAGAVLVKDKRIISTGYNGSPPGLPHCDDVGHLMEEGHCVRTIHGEHNAILQAAVLGGVSTKGSTLYTLYNPCIHCAKYVVMAGVKRVIIGEIYRGDKAIKYLKSAGIEVSLYEENSEWNINLQELFKNRIKKEDPKEGDVNITEENGNIDDLSISGGTPYASA